MNSCSKDLTKLSNKLISSDVDIEKKYRILKYIMEINVSKDDVSALRLMKAVKKCIKLPGSPGMLAAELFKKWEMFLAVSQTEDFKIDNSRQSPIRKLENFIAANDGLKSTHGNFTDFYNTCNRVNLENNVLIVKNEMSTLNNKNIESIDVSKNITGDCNISRFGNVNNSIKENLYLSEKRQSLNKNGAKSNNIEVEKPKIMKREDFSNNYSFYSNPDYVFNSKSKDSPSHLQTFSKLNTSKESLSPSNTLLKSNKKDHCRSKHEGLKSKQQKRNNQFAFENFIKNSALTKPIKTKDKRKVTNPSTNSELEEKKIKLVSIDVKNVSQNQKREFSYLTSVSSPISDKDMDERSVYNRTDVMFGLKSSDTVKEAQQDVDCTSKYSSERKIWIPTRKVDNSNNVPVAQIRLINGISENTIAHYDYQKLLEFEGDDRKLMKQMECFWEKLFVKVHKNHQRKDNETWRDAFLRIQNETDLKLKELSARVKRNNEEKIMAINKAKFLNLAPVKSNKKILHTSR